MREEKLKPLSEKFLDAAEGLADESMKKIRAFFAYEGEDRRYFDKARVGASMISAYGRLRASETNRMAVELSASKAEERAQK